MKIREVLDKKVGNTEYTRYITTLPKDVVKDSKLLGKELKARAEKGKIISAVTHVDGSARVQTLSKSQDPLFYELIKKFGKKTGVPVLLNTSFNRRNEPLVESPENALETFIRMDLDALVLEDFLIVKKGI